MDNKQTEWSTLDLKKNDLNFTGTLDSHLEHNNGTFVSLTLKLANGSLLRLRKNDYSISLEAPVVPVVTKFFVQLKGLQSQYFDSSEEADKFNEEKCNFEGTVDKVEVVKQAKQLSCDLPF